MEHTYKAGDIFYRVTDCIAPDIFLEEWPVVKTTPKGVWLKPLWANGWALESGKLRRVSVNVDMKKRFAYPTKKEALAAYVHRKNRQIARLEHQLGCAKAYLETALHPETHAWLETHQSTNIGKCVSISLGDVL